MAINDDRSCVFGKGMPFDTRMAFRYFSAHCWAWKQTVSVGQSSPILRVFAAFFRSFSAFEIHSLATVIMCSAFGIQHLTLMSSRPFYRPDHILAPIELGHVAHNDILLDPLTRITTRRST